MHYTSLASSALTVWRALESEGCDPKQIFEEAGLDPDKLYDPNARYPDENLYALWKRSVEVTGDPYFGLTVAHFWHPSNAHALGYSWLASATLRDAFLRVVRYLRIMTDKDQAALLEMDDQFKFVMHNPAPECPNAFEEIDASFSVLIGLSRKSYGEELSPLRLTMTRPEPEDTGPFDDFFRCPIEYDKTQNAIFFAKDVMTSPLPTGNAELALANDRVIADYLARFDRKNISVQVRAKLIEQLASGHATQQTVAEALNMSLRNLQRTLKNEGTSYKELLDDVRRQLAAQYMQQPGISINEVTYLLGFSEPANFSRAFKRWTGLSPSEYRTSA